MNYEEAVAYIEDIPRFTTKNSLDHTRECLRRLGDPQRKFRVIHVAGTNGKGSTCAFITSVLREAGYSCGLFTSPSLLKHSLVWSRLFLVVNLGISSIYATASS